MPRRYCGSCRSPLHADDGHSECVSCLGKSHVDAALAGSDCSHCESISLASLRTRIAFFSESDPAPRALPFSSSQGPGSDPACLAFATQRDVSRPFFPTWPASLCKRERSGLVRGKWRWAGRWQHVTGSFRCWGAVGLSNWPRRLRFASAAKAGMDAKLFRVLSKAVEELGLKKRDMRGCLNWMSQWLHISAHPLPLAGRRRPVTRPSHAGPLKRSLDAPTLQLDKRLRRSTLWRFFKSIRPSSSLP